MINDVLQEIKLLKDRIFKSNDEVNVYLYGSRARGDNTADSDWDVLVIYPDNESTKDNFIEYAFPFAELGWKLGIQITPIYYSESEWRAQKNSFFYINVTHDAVKL